MINWSQGNWHHVAHLVQLFILGLFVLTKNQEGPEKIDLFHQVLNHCIFLSDGYIGPVFFSRGIFSQ